MNLFSTEVREIRKLGIPMFFVCGGLALLGFWRGSLFPVCFFGSLSSLGFCFLCFPKIMKPVFALWMRITHTIGVALTTLVLGLAYYLVLTPSALIRRLAGGKLLPTKPDPDTSSYWVTRSERVQPRERFTKRY